MFYNVYLWAGAGYTLTPFENIEADHEQQALEIAVAQAEERGIRGVFFDELDEETREELEKAGEIMYIDASMEGATEPHYIDATNARIEEARAAD